LAKRLVIDGLAILREEFSTKQIASLIERTARWVSPETFRLLPLWFPEHGRGYHFYKGNWSEPQMNIKRGTDNATHKVEGNVYGWTCDHESIKDIVATLDAWDAWDDYPQSWPRTPGEKRPKGLIEMTLEIQRSADNRRAAIDRDLRTAGDHYPKEDVQAAQKYWDDWLASNPPLRGSEANQVLAG
jgi:hypothetical protein